MINEIIKKEKAYFLGHLGLGDNIISISAVRFLLQYYNTIYFLCKDIYKENVKTLMDTSCVKIISINSADEFHDCTQIIVNAYNNDNNIDVFVCGLHRQYLNSKITHPLLLNYQQNDKHYTVPDFYSFIKVLYHNIYLDLSIYYEYYHIDESELSIANYNKISEYKIIFLHTKASDKEISLDMNLYINNPEYIIICTNKNVYPIDHTNYNIANSYVNILVGYYITIIRNAREIHVVDSCFSAYVIPMNVTGKLNADKIIIYNRNNSSQIVVK